MVSGNGNFSCLEEGDFFRRFGSHFVSRGPQILGWVFAILVFVALQLGSAHHFSFLVGAQEIAFSCGLVQPYPEANDIAPSVAAT